MWMRVLFLSIPLKSLLLSRAVPPGVNSFTSHTQCLTAAKASLMPRFASDLEWKKAKLDEFPLYGHMMSD